MVDQESRTGSGARAEEDPLAGTSYRLLGYVAQGAMGEIVEAEHVALRRKVIVKLLRRAYASHPGFLDRLRLEAQALATLAPRTPHVVAAQDFGQTRDGRPFLVLESLRGRTLKEELRARHTLPPVEAVALAKELLEALACAHAAGIVHRDVKPGNIFLAESERGGRVLKLLDFGIAKVLAGASEEQAPSPLSAPTEEGMTLGTPRFLSPEQARGGDVGPASDLYAAGAVLYAMLAGRDPFAHREGIAAVIRAQVSEPARPPSFVSAQPIPEALDRIVLKALSKAPLDRFASAADFSAALDRALAPAPSVGRGGTELMDVTAFQGAGRGARGTPPPVTKTEPLDVSMFRGALVRRGPSYAVAMLASPAVPARVAAMVPAGRPEPSPPPELPRRPMMTAVLLVAASLLVLLLFFFLMRIR